ncbi:hypothetical protein [Salipiger sp. PrR003]|uniref:hypothetical protein n=1 Tax=Salipiger sp. PrR003 TaxID=2706776 RepID=UPI0013D9BC62|nr:hypothetical protein [Salipiger sp. PrR003]NDV51528.1 hypothetical protein [Salipiger sp. PrR003]
MSGNSAPGPAFRDCILITPVTRDGEPTSYSEAIEWRVAEMQDGQEIDWVVTSSGGPDGPGVELFEALERIAYMFPHHSGLLLCQVRPEYNLDREPMDRLNLVKHLEYVARTDGNEDEMSELIDAIDELEATFDTGFVSGP